MVERMRRGAGGLLVWLLVVPAAWAGLPQVSNILPRGGQRGAEMTVDFHGGHLRDVEEIMLYDPGIEVLEIGAPSKNGKRVSATLRIAADAPLGPYRMRVRTQDGLSDLRTFWVGQFPAVAEKEPNGDFSAPQVVAPGSTVEGVVTQEDIDYYQVELKEGERLSVEIEAIRLSNQDLFDAFIAVLDDERFQLVSADDTVLLRQDAFVSMVAPRDGRYWIAVREAAFQGDKDYQYRLHVGAFPRPDIVQPLGGRRGETVELTFHDPAGGDPWKRTVTIPEDAPAEYRLTFGEDGLEAPSPLPFRVSDFPEFAETVEESNRRNPTIIEAAAPFAINGVIAAEGEQDWFRFRGEKGQEIVVRAYATTLGSPLDPVINLFEHDGKHLKGNDDQMGLDSELKHKVDAGGWLELRVRDHLGAGGERHAYRIEVTPEEPSLRVFIPEFHRRRPQDRQMFAVPRGGRMAGIVNIARENFRGEVTLRAENLPAGVSMTPVTIPEGLKEAPVVFTADADAALSGSLADLIGEAMVDGELLSGRYQYEIELVEQGNTTYNEVAVDRLPVAVARETPFRISVETPPVPLVRNGQLDLNVRIDRDEGFEEKVRLRMLWTPPGVSAPRTRDVAKDQGRYAYGLSANGNAKLGDWRLVIVGEANRGGEILTATGYIPVTVASSNVEAALEMAAVEQGQETVMIVKLTHNAPIEGEGVARLHGLPPNVEAGEVTFAAGDEQARFVIKAAENARAGRHKNVFCELIYTLKGVDMRYSSGRETLRVDAPPPVPVAAKAKAKEAPAQSTKAEEPVSRLELLRQQAMGAPES